MDEGIHPPSEDAPEEEWARATKELQEWLEREVAKDGGKEIGYASGGQINRCVAEPIGCGKLLVHAPNPFHKAFVPGHVYSDLGVREFKISGLCEWCFDKITKEPGASFDIPDAWEV